MSPWGYLLFTGWAILSGFLLDGRGLVALAGMELAFGLAWSRQGLRPLRRLRFWTFVLTGVALGPFLLDEPDLWLGPFPLSREGLAAGLEMAGRAFGLTLAFSLGIGSLSLSDIVTLFDRLGLRGLGFATALAVNLLETLEEMARATWQAIWLRGGARRPWVALRLFLITTVANTLRCGDEVVSAAVARAFDPNGGERLSLPPRPADLWVAVSLIGCTGLLLALEVGP